MSRLHTLLFALPLLSLSACDLADPGEIGPDGGPHIAEHSEDLTTIYSPLCDTTNIKPKLRLVSRDSFSLTIEIDTVDPDCRWFLDYYDLDYLGGAIYPKPPEWQLAFGPGYELPVQVTHTGRLPDTEYCYSGKRIENGWATGVTACYQTRTLLMKW